MNTARALADLAAVPHASRGGVRPAGCDRGRSGGHRTTPRTPLRHDGEAVRVAQRLRRRDCAVHRKGAAPPAARAGRPGRSRAHRDLLGVAARRPRAGKPHVSIGLDPERQPHPLAHHQARAGGPGDDRRGRTPEPDGDLVVGSIRSHSRQPILPVLFRPPRSRPHRLRRVRVRTRRHRGRPHPPDAAGHGSDPRRFRRSAGSRVRLGAPPSDHPDENDHGLPLGFLQRVRALRSRSIQQTGFFPKRRSTGPGG